MKTEDLALILNALQTLIIMLSLIAVIWQLKEFNRSTRLNMYFRSYDYFLKVNEIPINKPHINAPLHPKNRAYNMLNEQEQDTYNYLVLSMAVFEHLFLLREEKLLDPMTWKAWENWLVKGIFPSKEFRFLWEEEETYFIPKFAEYVNKLYHKFKKQQQDRDQHVLTDLLS